MDHRLFLTMDRSQHLYSSYDNYPPPTCKVDLKNRELWEKFHELETEMIITKTGRRMFPSLHIQISELDPRAHYCILLEMTLATRCRYKYSSSGGWVPAGTEEAQNSQRAYLHPESPSTGEYWMSQPISFGRLKLTNTVHPETVGQVVLSSMHKYQPRIIIAKTSDIRNICWAPTTSVEFPETQFIAVTAYQNERITKLKIDNNPFAKGFRENGLSKCKRKRTVDEEEGRPSTKQKIEDGRTNTKHFKVSSSYQKIEDDRISVCSSSSSPSSPEVCHQQGSLSPVASPKAIQNCPIPIGANKNLPYGLTPSMSFYPYYYPQYAFYGPSVWGAPPQYYYQHPLPSIVAPEDLTIRAPAEKPKKLTDFSIRAITGCS